MSVTCETASRPPMNGGLTVLRELTHRRLASPGAVEVAIPPELRRARDRTGLRTLEAAAWRVGEPAFAECRTVSILGPGTEVLNTMIFPTAPDGPPVFAAELLVFGGLPRLAFIDLQTPGAGAAMRRRAFEESLAARSRVALPNCEEPAPEWAVHWSAGAPLHSRPESVEAVGEMVRAYDVYLDAWLALIDGGDRSAEPDAAEQLARYKRSHVAHSPGTQFLSRLFGPDWTRRFLNEFLYA